MISCQLAVKYKLQFKQVWEVNLLFVEEVGINCDVFNIQVSLEGVTLEEALLPSPEPHMVQHI